MLSHAGINRNEAEFIGNKHTYTHSTLDINKITLANVDIFSHFFTVKCRKQLRKNLELKLSPALEFVADITLHYIDILAMYCRVISPFYLAKSKCSDIQL